MTIFEATEIRKNKTTGRSLGYFQAKSMPEAAIQAAKKSGFMDIRIFKTKPKR